MVDGHDTIYVADALKGSIVAFARDGRLIEDIRGGSKPRDQFFYPVGVMVDRGRELYVSDSYSRNVRRFIRS